MNNYDSNLDVFGIEPHPPYFTDEGLKEFEKAIGFLVDKGVNFTTPQEYYEYYNFIKIILDKEMLHLSLKMTAHLCH